jgi:hypothetical protein
MDKAQRAEMLRKRFKAKGGFPFVFTGTRKAKPEPRPKPTKICLQWPEANNDTRRAGIWMHAPNPKAEVTPRIKRNAGVPVFIRIAEKTISKKLKRRHANAESLLAERALLLRP